MTKPPNTPDVSPQRAARMQRLEEQLRANLKRRKDAARARTAPDETPPSPERTE